MMIWRCRMVRFVTSFFWEVPKRRMYKLYPQYNNFSQAQEEWDGFCESLKEC
jgi:hypothetical protein